MEFESEADVQNAVTKCVEYALDKTHKLNAYSFKTFMDAMNTPDEFVATEEKFEAKVIEYQWFLICHDRMTIFRKHLRISLTKNAMTSML